MIATEAFEQVEFDSQDAIWAWFDSNHAQTDSIWAVTFKKHVSGKYLSRDDVLDALVAYGWIDGIRRKVDDDRTMQLLSPRKQQAWAETYRSRAARLEAEGRMHPAGRAAIEQAKASGKYDAMKDVDALIVPADLRAAFTGEAGAWFDAAALSYRRNVLRWLASAKTAPTRQKRIAEIAGRAARGEKVPQF